MTSGGIIFTHASKIIFPGESVDGGVGPGPSAYTIMESMKIYAKKENGGRVDQPEVWLSGLAV